MNIKITVGKSILEASNNGRGRLTDEFVKDVLEHLCAVEEKRMTTEEMLKNETR